MLNEKCFLRPYLLLLCLVLLFVATGYAQEKKDSSKDAAPTEQLKGSSKNIVLLMDSSGSMRRTDPNSYRKPAAKLFSSLIGADSRIAVVSFGDTVKTLLPLSDNNRAMRPAIEKAIDKISSREFSTHMHLAVKKGIEMLKDTKEGSGILVLMSDGKLTLGSKEKDEAAMEELLRLLPEAAKAGIKIYTIPFTEESDIALLERIAKETGAFSRLAKSDKDVHMIFASIFEKIKSPDALPIRDDGFDIDSEIQEAILLITKQPKTKTTLINPKGIKLTFEKRPKEVNWYSADVFDMITIPNPEHGRWKVNLSTKEGNRVYVLTNLKLKSSFERNIVYKGEQLKIDAWLERDGGVITEQDVLNKLTFVLESMDPSKKATQFKMVLDALQIGEVPSKGRYIAELTVEQVGDYTLRIIAEGNTFKREKTLEFMAEEPPPQPIHPPKGHAVHSPQMEEQSMGWSKALVIFGITNGALVLIGGLVFLGIRLIKRRTTKR
jgi:Mg-chelatase subunit ChlD